MQCMDLIEHRPAADTSLIADGEVDRRVRDLIRVKALSGRLKPARERRFLDILARVRTEAASGRLGARRAALSALDLLSLELCDD
jgi:hypothetical protein